MRCFKYRNRPLYQGNTLLIGARALPLEGTFKSFSPRVSLDYKFAPDSMAYVLWSRGYRPGGINRQAAAGPYAPDYLTNFELGFKTSWFDWNPN